MSDDRAAARAAHAALCATRGVRDLYEGAGCIHYEKTNGIDNEPNPKEN